MRVRAVVLVVCGSTLALAQGDERGFRVDSSAASDLVAQVTRASKLLEAGEAEEALALLERVERDPRAHEGLLPLGDGAFGTVDALVRARLRRIDEATRRVYDARHAVPIEHLEEQGTREALGRLLARFPASAHARAAALRLAELDLEAGAIDDAAAHVADAIDAGALDEGAPASDRERALLLRPALHALTGRRRECSDALAALDGERETAARRLAARAAQEAEALRGSVALATTALATATWTLRTPDAYEPYTGSAGPCPRGAVDAGRLYFHDGARCAAVALDSGKLVWRASFRAAGGYVPPLGPCRLALGPRVVACALPSGGLVTVDRESGEVLARVTPENLRGFVGATELTDTTIALLAAEDTLVVALATQEMQQDFYVLGLDARTGALRWKVCLGHAAYEVSGQHVVPLLARLGGRVFVLPGWGAVAALEPETGAVLWLRRYDSLRDNAPVQPVRHGRRTAVGVASPPLRRALLVGARGRLVVGAHDAKVLRALDPRTGEEAWSTNDDGSQILAPYGAGAAELDAEGNLWVVAERAERRAVLPRRAMVDEPCVAGDTLLVPLARGSIVRVDLEHESGRPPPSTRIASGRANLAVYAGKVFALTNDSVALLGEPDAGPVASFSDAASASRALGDPRCAVRDAAARMLGELGAHARSALDESARSADAERALRAQALLDELAARERRARFEAILEGARLGPPERVARLVGKDPHLRETEVHALARQASCRPIFEELCADPEPAVAQAAAIAALTLGSRAGMPVVRRLLESKSLGERRLAMTALAEAGGAEDFELYAKGFADEDGAVRERAVAAALRHGDERVAPAFVAGLGDKLDFAKRLVVDAVANGGGRQPPPALAAPLMRRLARDADSSLRRNAVLALRGTKDAAHRATLAEALDDRDPSVLTAAEVVLLDAIEREDPPEVAPAVLEKLVERSLSAEPRRAEAAILCAQRAVAHGRVIRAAAFARAATSVASAAGRDAALAGLAKSVTLAPVDSNDVAAIGTLTLASAPRVRWSAFDALLAARGPGRGALLASGLRDSDASVRSLIEVRLPACGEDVAFELLLPAARDEQLGRLVAAFEPRALALAALRATESADEERRAAGKERLQKLHDALPALIASEHDAAVAERLRLALARSSDEFAPTMPEEKR